MIRYRKAIISMLLLIAFSFIFEQYSFTISHMQLAQQKEDLSTKYTVLKLVDPDHITKLIKYLDEHKDNRKTSYCRFYLRGLCIMKSEHCRFAHDFDQLDLNSEEYTKISIFDWTLGEKEQKKRFFLEKTDFHQRPLFFIKNLDYLWLYSYQFTERYKKSGNQPLSIAEINKNDSVRNRIREIMHRQQWDKFINYIEALCPDVDYTISMFSTWFGKIGFEKAQTFCKFGDFIRYLAFVKGYAEVNIVVPPLTTRSVYFIKHKSTYMAQQLEAIKEDSQMYKSIVRKNKEERMKKLPEDLHKRFICRFYMAGNCEKERHQCSYVHNIEDLRYDPNIDFLPAYRQPPKSKEDRLNYISLHKYYVSQKAPNDQEITLDDINSKFGLKDKIRKRVHLQLYADFLRKIEEIYQESFLKLALVKKEYTRFGFNHTDENKFGQLEGCFWDLGFHQEDIVDRNREKHQYVYRIPAVEEMDKLYYHKILSILKEEIDLNNIGKDDYQQILESSIRRLIYSHTSKQQFEIPLHVYLRKKGTNLKNVIEQNFPEYCPFIFFESSQENFKKLLDLLKKYFKKQKKFMYRMDDVDSFIRGLSKEEINMNNFVNLKNLIELALLELGKEIYFWPLGNASIVIDRSHPNKELHHTIQLQEKPLQEIEKERCQKYWDQWMVVVDSEETFNFCRLILSHCNVYGVDLEGKLSQNGYIDFIQISCSLMKKKHIFIIDVYFLQQQLSELFLQVQHFLKSIFENQILLKIMHACQQDSIALYSCLGIRIKNVFDTSGVEIYLQQMKNYQEMRELNHTFQHTLKKVHCTKTPGLNQILEKWQAPKGVNEYKESMKKVFTEAPRSYYTTRPIVEEFLLYSARDVEDLIEVWAKMSKAQTDGLWHVIGEIYTPID